MNKKEQFFAFLESISDDKNADLISTVKEAFALTEAYIPPSMLGSKVKSPTEGFRDRQSEKKTTPLTPEEQGARSDKFKREASANRQAGGRMSGAMAQIVKFAANNAVEVEQWMNTVLKPAIKAGKVEADKLLGTDSAKTGFLSRVKNAGKAMLGEGAEVDFDEEDVDSIGADDDVDYDDESQFGGDVKTDRREVAKKREFNKV